MSNPLKQKNSITPSSPVRAPTKTLGSKPFDDRCMPSTARAAIALSPLSAGMN